MSSMNQASHTVLMYPNAGRPAHYEKLQEEHEVAVLGIPQGSAPVTTTVINMPREISVPDHVVWSLFNTLFMNFCCLGFIAFAYSVKVCGLCGGWGSGEGVRGSGKVCGRLKLHLHLGCVGPCVLGGCRGSPPVAGVHRPCVRPPVCG